MTVAPRRWRDCPACARRPEAIVDPDCLVCSGDGVLELGPAALARFSPQVVARAVEMNLDAAARSMLVRPGADLHTARSAVHLQVGRLRRGGLLAGRRLPRLPPEPAGGWVPDPDDPGAADQGFRAAGFVTRLVDPATLDVPQPDPDDDWTADTSPAPVDPPAPAAVPVFARARFSGRRRRRHRKR